MYSGDYLQLLTTVAWLLGVLVAGLAGSLAGTAGGRAGYRWLALFAAGQVAAVAWQSSVQAVAVVALLEAGRRIWNRRAPGRWRPEYQAGLAISAALIFLLGGYPRLAATGNVLAEILGGGAFAAVVLWPAHCRAAPAAERWERLLLALGGLVFGATAFAGWEAPEPGGGNPIEGGSAIAAVFWIAGGVMAGVGGSRVRPRLALVFSAAALAVVIAGGWLVDRIAGEMVNRQREAWQRHAAATAAQLRSVDFGWLPALPVGDDSRELAVLAAALADDAELLRVAVWHFAGHELSLVRWRGRDGQTAPANRTFPAAGVGQFAAAAPFTIGMSSGDATEPPMVLQPLSGDYWLGLEYAPEAWTVAMARARFVSLGVLAALILALAGGGLLLWREAIEQARVVERARQQVAEKARTEFLTFISHELRTPLQTILGRAELLAG